VPDEAAASRATKGARQAGVLVDVQIGPPTRFVADDQAFDVAVVDDTGGLVGGLGPADRANALAGLRRVLRPGGRVVLIGALPPRGGLSALLGRKPGPASAGSTAAREALAAAGFTPVRTLAEREGLVFIEAIKPRTLTGEQTEGAGGSGEAGAAGQS